jgi:hypothetical protein
VRIKRVKNKAAFPQQNSNFLVKEPPQTFPSSKAKHNPSNPNPKLTRQPTKIAIKTQNPEKAERISTIYTAKTHQDNNSYFL